MSCDCDMQKPKEVADFDELLDIVGSEGRFQKILLYGYLGPLSLLVPLFMYNIVFMVYQPDHWCHVPGRNSTTDLDTWKSLTVPIVQQIDGTTRLSQCSMYNASRHIVPCQHGWEYDRSDYYDTLPSQYDWVCEQGEQATNALTCGSVGNALGTILLGQVADKIGRKPILFLVYTTNVIFRVTSLFIANDFTWFLIIQTIHGMSFPLTYIVSAMLICEVSGKAFRAWIYSFTWIIWVIGFSLLPALAWLTRTWFVMGLVTSIPGIALLFYWWLVPESPRWLVSRGDIPKAKAIIKKIAQWNGTTQSLELLDLDSILTKLSQKTAKEKTGLAFLKLFTKLRLARNTILLSIMWATNMIVNLLIMLVTHKIPGNQFLNFFILGIIELPSSYLGGFLADRIGRRWTQVTFFFLCATSCAGVACGYWFHAGFYEILGFAIAAKFSITVTFMVIFIQATEIFPTQLRSTGSGFASTVGSMMNILSPYAAYFGKIHDALPFVLLAVVGFIAAISSYFVPETLNKKLPESLEEANDLGRMSKEERRISSKMKNSDVV